MGNETSGDNQQELESLRLKWRAVRDSRLLLQSELLAAGLDKAAVRKNQEYRRLKKEQNRLSTLMKHIEQRLNAQACKTREKRNRPLSGFSPHGVMSPETYMNMMDLTPLSVRGIPSSGLMQRNWFRCRLAACSSRFLAEIRYFLNTPREITGP